MAATAGTASAGDVVTAVRRVVVHLTTLGTVFAREQGMTFTDVKALIALNDLRREEVPATPGELGRRLGLASASVTQLVDRLAAQGLVRREPDPTDRRRVRIAVTERAGAAGIATFGPTLEAIRGLAQGYSARERAVILDFLERVAALEASAPAARRDLPAHPARGRN